MSMRSVLLRLEAASRDMSALISGRPKNQASYRTQAMASVKSEINKALEELEALGHKIQPLSKGSLPNNESHYRDPADEPTGQDDIDSIGRHVV